MTGDDADKAVTEASGFIMPGFLHSKLCKCEHCQKLIESENLQFLYEQFEESDIFNSLQHEKLLQKINEEEIQNFLCEARKENILPVMDTTLKEANNMWKKFASFVSEHCKDRVVTEEDIVNFFKIYDEQQTMQ